MHERVGRCIAVTGYEEDFLDFFDEASTMLVGITQLIREAGHPDLVVNWTLTRAFENEGTGWDDDRQREEREDYRARTGRPYPPVLHVRLLTEVAEAPPEETAAYWAAQRARNAEIPRHA